VTFAYCRQGGVKLPCRKILDCWFESFDVAEFVRAHYTPEQIDRFLAPPPPKLVSLYDLMRQAQELREP
jgi:hypothetical protein